MGRGDGFLHYPGFFTELEQQALLAEVLAVALRAPFVRPRLTGFGHPYRVEATSAGALGWCSDKHGYGYRATHPLTGQPWPALGSMTSAAVDRLLAMAGDAVAAPFHADSCLLNRYREDGRLGLHRDASEAAMEAPIVSISLGDTARFLVGGSRRRDPQREVLLGSGDGLVMAGAARGYYHGVAGLLVGSSDLVPGGGRISLTIRQVWRRDVDGAVVGGGSQALPTAVGVTGR